MTSDRASQQGLRFGRLGDKAVHLCIDMQRMFREDTPWRTPWMDRVLPKVRAIAEHNPRKTLFTRFITGEQPGAGHGVWSRYWKRWAELTRSEINPELLELLPDLKALCPPAIVIDKRVYSPWWTPELSKQLTAMNCDTLIVTGLETDVCVLTTVLGAVDRGYRVIVVADALCSSADETHEAAMTVYGSRFSEHIELILTDDLLDQWRSGC